MQSIIPGAQIHIPPTAAQHAAFPQYAKKGRGGKFYWNLKALFRQANLIDAKGVSRFRSPGGTYVQWADLRRDLRVKI